MSELFILQNQDKLFLNKQKDWTDGRDLNSLFKTPHKDEAINQLVEISAKDYRQRIKVIPCGVTDKGLPQIDPELMPEPLPKVGKDLLDEPDTDPDAIAHETNHDLNDAPDDDLNDDDLNDDDPNDGDLNDDGPNNGDHEPEHTLGQNQPL